MLITLDFETRSEADLRAVGAYEYARHPSTEAMCLAWQVDELPTKLWHPTFQDLTPLQGRNKTERSQPPRHLEARPFPKALGIAIELGATFEAHNASFERYIWRWVMVEKHGWPEVPENLWVCSAATAASYALRRKLDHVSADLGLTENKDAEGHRLMMRMSKPRRPTKADPDSPWHQKRADLDRLFAYCIQDVRTEHALSKSLRPLTREEQEMWQIDTQINDRGIYCDRAMVESALAIASEARRRACMDLDRLTDGAVTGPTKRIEMVEWLSEQGYPMKSLAKEPIANALERNLPAEIDYALRLWSAINRTSTKKYVSMLRSMGSDNRLRDLLLYHAASTGRWGGRRIQPQNFPRGFGRDMEEVCEYLLQCDYDTLDLLFGDPMDVLAKATRGALGAPPGRELIVVDFSSIEARGTFWLCDDQDALDIFRRGQCMYRDAAAEIFGIPPDQAQAIPKDSHERGVGKIAILQLGYGSGPKAYADSCWKQARIEMKVGDRDLPADDPANEGMTGCKVVDAYRTKYWRVKSMWYEIENAAIEAVRRGHGGAPVPCCNGKLAFRVWGRFLHMRLPNGRLLSYLDPEIRKVRTPWGDLKDAVTFMGQNTHTHQWERCSTYGGKLTENGVQAFCRDLLAEAIKRLAAHPIYHEIVLDVHDEIVSEVDAGVGSVEEYEQIMCEVPTWAAGMPIEAEGWRGVRYRK